MAIVWEPAFDVCIVYRPNKNGDVAYGEYKPLPYVLSTDAVLLWNSIRSENLILQTAKGLAA
jgi:hypothetical protein